VPGQQLIDIAVAMTVHDPGDDVSTLLLVLGTALAWTAVGRDVPPLRELPRLPLHAIQKLGFYHRISSGKATSAWIRTDRK
jgi:hypothetical protein